MSCHQSEFSFKACLFPSDKLRRRIKKISKNRTTRKINVALKERPVPILRTLIVTSMHFYADLLSEKYENKLKSAGLSECVLAFRGLRKSNIDFAHEAFQQIKAMGSVVL
ncbi:hypothetical protein TUM3811_08820 [Shewanella algae]|nr:hypothetical protein TUM3811_08820 [Shewanella algae]